MQEYKFAKLVTQIEQAGIKGHIAYEIANQIDSDAINYVTDKEIKAIAIKVVEEYKQCDEADYYEQ